MTAKLDAAQITNAINSLFSGITAEKNEKGSELYNALKEHIDFGSATKALERGKANMFDHHLLRPLSSLVDGILYNNGIQDARLAFILKHGKFVERHFLTLIEQCEGSACSSDKSSTIMSRLVMHLMTGKHICPKEGDKLHYGHCSVIFTSDEDVLEFFDAIYALHYGKYNKYIMFLGKTVTKK
jgi:hypothetical protein